jgi:inhibitor of cysteine peptidase
MNTRKLRFFRSLFIVVPLASLLFFSGCGGDGKSPTSNLSNFETDEELRTYLIDQYADSVTPGYLRAQVAANETDTATAGAGADQAGYSGTNLQEAGVDESEMIKTDGNYLYIASSNAVRIVSAVPPGTLQKVQPVTVNGQVNSIYLHDGLLAVLYRPSDGEGEPWRKDDAGIGIGMPYWIPVQEKTGILLVDVSQPESPQTIKDIQVDGYFVSSRLTEGRLHVITQFLPDLPPLKIWYDGSKADKTAVTTSNESTLSSLTLDELIPSCTVYDSTGAIIREGRAIKTADIIRPETTAGGSLVSMITIDVENPANDFTSVGFVADVHHVYASTDSLYLISTLYHYPDVAVDDDSVVSSDAATFETQIYKFNLKSQPIAYSAEGKVPGELLNSFSLGEYKEVLRVAAGTGNTWDGTSENHVYCLKENLGKLEVVGAIHGIAPGERLYSARFMGDRGFLVTFVQVDPLFTLDLSDPTNPTIVGELKVPGYSTYLHPLNDNYLLALGQETSSEDDSVRVSGLQLSIFDISDFANPKLIHSQTIGDQGTYSEALYNHKALTFWAEKNLISLPVNLYEYSESPENSWDYGANTFNGVYIYRLTDEYDLNLLGRIELSDLDNPDGAWYGLSWCRGVFIDNFIYAATPTGVKAAPIDNIAEPFITLDLME